MFKISFQKFLYIILLFTLIFQYVSAHEEHEEQEVNNAIGDETEIEKYDPNEEEKIRNLKMPHVDGIKEKKVEKLEIPKIIHQYVRSKENISDHNKKNMESWKTLNSNWEHRLYDYSDIKSFMENQYSRLIDLWNVLSYEEQIHMWKYAVLDVVGGAYVNINCYCTKPISQWLDKYDKSNIIIGLDHLYIPDQILNEKKLTDSLQFNVSTIISAPGHEIFTKMPFYIHRFRVLSSINTYEIDPDFKKYGRTFFSAGTALFTESVFDYLIENNVILENIVEGGLVKDVAVLNTHGFSYESSDLNNLPDDVYSLYYPEKSKVKDKNDYII